VVDGGTPASARFCEQCGGQLGAGARFCGACGAAIPQAEADLAEAAEPEVTATSEAAAARESPAPQPGAAPSSERNGRRKSAAILLALALMLASGVGVGVLVASGGGSDTDAGAAAGEVFLEPVNSSRDPFTPSVGTDRRNVRPPSTTTTTRTTATPATAGPTTTAAAARGIPVATGDTPGLYGGTRDAGSCDPEKLVGFLEQNPAKAAAWAGVLGIRPSEIRAFVATLTPVVLRSDTRVTNHGFRNGHATEIPAVLQAGTAVLVDRYGQPVAKCFCGNPLTAPRPVRAPRYTGPRWPGFAPGGIVVIDQSTTVVNVFTVVDPATGETFGRPSGTTGDSDGPVPPPLTGPAGQTLGTGAVQVTLQWSSAADLDLHVVDPTGTEISYQQRNASSGGSLDVDSNAGCHDAASNPVENVFWPEDGAPSGEYVVSVTYFAECPPGGAGAQPFTLTVQQDGRIVDQETGTVAPGETAEVTRFSR